MEIVLGRTLKYIHTAMSQGVNNLATRLRWTPTHVDRGEWNLLIWLWLSGCFHGSVQTELLLAALSLFTILIFTLEDIMCFW